MYSRMLENGTNTRICECEYSVHLYYACYYTFIDNACERPGDTGVTGQRTNVTASTSVLYMLLHLY